MRRSLTLALMALAIGVVAEAGPYKFILWGPALAGPTESQRDPEIFNRQPAVGNPRVSHLGRNGRAVICPSNRGAQRPGMAVPHFEQAPSGVRR